MMTPSRRSRWTAWTLAPENVEDNSWTIWAYEHMYTVAEPDEATQAFIRPT